MSEIDPWALPQGGVGNAGIPSSGPATAPRPAVKALSRTLPIIVMGLAAVYAVASIAEIFIINSQVSLANQFTAEAANGTISDNALSQANASDSHVNSGSWVAAGIYLAALVAFIVWERKLKVELGSVGARRAVLNKAGYVYFRATWAISFVLGLFLSSQSNNSNESTMQDVINHDHELMLYFGLRALLGVVLVFFAFRLMRISEDGVARLRAAMGY
jgi:hypothetical protein